MTPLREWDTIAASRKKKKIVPRRTSEYKRVSPIHPFRPTFQTKTIHTHYHFDDLPIITVFIPRIPTDKSSAVIHKLLDDGNSPYDNGTICFPFLGSRAGPATHISLQRAASRALRCDPRYSCCEREPRDPPHLPPIPWESSSLPPQTRCLPSGCAKPKWRYSPIYRMSQR